MSATYGASNTALLLIDPYNDFNSDGGKLFPLAKAVIESTGTITNISLVQGPLLRSVRVRSPAR